MDEWLAIVLAGALGGAVTTFMPSGTDFPWPQPLASLLKGHIMNFMANVLRNTLLGSLASFLMWALADPSQPLGGGSANVGQLASGIIVGGAGGSIVTNLFRQAKQNESSAEMNEELTDLLRLSIDGIEVTDGSQDHTAGQERDI